MIFILRSNGCNTEAEKSGNFYLENQHLFFLSPKENQSMIMYYQRAKHWYKNKEMVILNTGWQDQILNIVYKIDSQQGRPYKHF